MISGTMTSPTMRAHVSSILPMVMTRGAFLTGGSSPGNCKGHVNWNAASGECHTFLDRRTCHLSLHQLHLDGDGGGDEDARDAQAVGDQAWVEAPFSALGQEEGGVGAGEEGDGVEVGPGAEEGVDQEAEQGLQAGFKSH